MNSGSGIEYFLKVLTKGLLSTATVAKFYPCWATKKTYIGGAYDGHLYIFFILDTLTFICQLIQVGLRKFQHKLGQTPD